MYVQGNFINNTITVVVYNTIHVMNMCSEVSPFFDLIGCASIRTYMLTLFIIMNEY